MNEDGVGGFYELMNSSPVKSMLFVCYSIINGSNLSVNVIHQQKNTSEKPFIKVSQIHLS